MSSIQLLRGRDHTQLGACTVEHVGSSLAVGMSAGARAKARPAVDPNEDVGAVARGPRADLLVVADGHFGREASELVVDHVLGALGEDPPPADLAYEDLVALFFDAGVAVQRETSRAGCRHPHSRTTLALALVTDDSLQWAALGDSCIVLATEEGGARLDLPRNAYLGYRFDFADVATALTSGRTAWDSNDFLVLSTDGLVDAVRANGLELAAFVSSELRNTSDAPRAAGGLLQLAVAGHVDDAVTIAIASNRSSGANSSPTSP